MYEIFGINTSRDISKLSQISLTYKRLVKLRKTILKCHSWYLCQISLLIMLLPILIRILRNQTDITSQSEDDTCDQEIQVTTRACHINKASAGNRDCAKLHG